MSHHPNYKHQREAIEWARAVLGQPQRYVILDTETKHRQVEMQKRMMRWMDNQIGDAVSDIPRSMLPARSDFLGVEGPPPNEDAAALSLMEE